MKLSLIICVYNTDKEYLEGCLSSIKESTLSHSKRDDIEYELIIVDDGSTVDYSELTDRYGVIYKKTENHGILKARTLGTQLASGDYIAFCDSDDTVSFNYHLPMLSAAMAHGADIVINDWAFNSPAGLTVCKSDSTVRCDLYAEGDDVLRLFLEKCGREHSYYVLWNKIYRADVLRYAIDKVISATREFDRYNYSEDVLINFYAFKEAEKLINVHTGYYFYRIHPTQSVTVSSYETLEKQINFMSHTLSVMEDEVRKTDGSSELLLRIKEWRGLMARAHFSHAKANAFVELYPLIKERYGVKKLSRSTYKDERCYLKFSLLPKNFDAIDKQLFGIWIDGTLPKVKHKRCEYIDRTLEYMKVSGAVKVAVGATTHNIEVIKPPFKKRLRSNAFLLRVARVLFPKGSKLRKILKNKL